MTIPWSEDHDLVHFKRKEPELSLPVCLMPEGGVGGNSVRKCRN